MSKKLNIVVISIPVTIVFLLFGKEITFLVSIPFRNTNGELDFNIIWSAFSGMATFFVGLIAFWQTHIFRKRDDILQNQTYLIKREGRHEELNNWFACNSGKYPNDRNSVNTFKIRKENSEWKVLSLQIKFQTSNRIIPDMFIINKIEIKPSYSGNNVLDDNMIYSKEPAVITDLLIDGFKCFVEIIDDNLEAIFKNEFIVSIEIVFIKMLENHSIETKYLYIFKVDLQQNEKIEEFWIKPAIFEDMILKFEGVTATKNFKHKINSN